MKIGIIGYGVVGKALGNMLTNNRHKILTYDTATCEPFGKEFNKLNNECKLVFICSSTRFSRTTNALDCDYMDELVEKLTGNRIIVVRSTVTPGTTDYLQKKHPNHDIYFVPEFLNEDTAVADMLNPRHIYIIGTCKNIDSADDDPNISLILHLCPYVEKVGYQILPAIQAEFIKLATNSFYFIKLMFAYTMYNVGMSQEALNILNKDNWIGENYLSIKHKDYDGAGGMCLPKDMLALTHLTKSKLLETACDLNEELLDRQGRSMNDWL